MFLGLDSSGCTKSLVSYIGADVDVSIPFNPQSRLLARTSGIKSLLRTSTIVPPSGEPPRATTTTTTCRRWERGRKEGRERRIARPARHNLFVFRLSLSLFLSSSLVIAFPPSLSPSLSLSSSAPSVLPLLFILPFSFFVQSTSFFLPPLPLPYPPPLPPPLGIIHSPSRTTAERGRRRVSTMWPRCRPTNELTGERMDGRTERVEFGQKKWKMQSGPDEVLNTLSPKAPRPSQSPPLFHIQTKIVGQDGRK